MTNSKVEPYLLETIFLYPDQVQLIYLLELRSITIHQLWKEGLFRAWWEAYLRFWNGSSFQLLGQLHQSGSEMAPGGPDSTVMTDPIVMLTRQR